MSILVSAFKLTMVFYSKFTPLVTSFNTMVNLMCNGKDPGSLFPFGRKAEPLRCGRRDNTIPELLNPSPQGATLQVMLKRVTTVVSFGVRSVEVATKQTFMTKGFMKPARGGPCIAQGTSCNDFDSQRARCQVLSERHPFGWKVIARAREQ